jgi:hypothetical protein
MARTRIGRSTHESGSVGRWAAFVSPKVGHGRFHCHQTRGSFGVGVGGFTVYQTPGAFEAMQHGACTKLLGVHLVKGAGHSVVEEQPEQVNRLLIEFLRGAA